MTSFGRGRGWYLQNREQGLRRPGGVFCTNDVVKDILNKLSSCGTCEQVSPQLIQEIIDLITSPTNKESLRETCDMLWKQSILNNTFTTKLALIFCDNKVAFIEDTNNETIRKHFLNFLQDNYISREKNRMEDKKVFANVVLLHAEVYYHMRLSNGKKLKPLAEPLIHYLGDLMQNNVEENIYFIMAQILKSGKDLYIACPEQLEEFMMTIRETLLKENSDYSRNFRAVLLLLIELANNNYEIKDTRLRQFYTSNIKSLMFEYPFVKEELAVDSETKTGNDNNLSKDLQDVDNVSAHRITKEEANEVSNKHSHHSKNPHIPRAIRGTGGLDTKREDDVNTKLNSMKITSSRQKNADFWDHDDRFHKDYE